MGVFNQIRGRKTETVTADAAVGSHGVVDDEKTPKDFAHSDSDSDNLSLEARNEKEVQQHPDQVTAGAQEGVQKAEAAALVWTKPVLYATFAW